MISSSYVPGPLDSDTSQLYASEEAEKLLKTRSVRSVRRCVGVESLRRRQSLTCLPPATFVSDAKKSNCCTFLCIVRHPLRFGIARSGKGVI